MEIEEELQEFLNRIMQGILTTSVLSKLLYVSGPTVPIFKINYKSTGVYQKTTFRV